MRERRVWKAGQRAESPGGNGAYDQDGEFRTLSLRAIHQPLVLCPVTAASSSYQASIGPITRLGWKAAVKNGEDSDGDVGLGRRA